MVSVTSLRGEDFSLLTNWLKMDARMADITGKSDEEVFLKARK